MNTNVVEVRQVDVRASGLVGNDAKQITPQFQEDEEAVVIQQQKAGLKRTKTISIIAILLAITQIVLASIHLANHKLDLAKALLASGIVNLLVCGITIYWSNKTRDSYNRTTAELLQPRPNDRLTRSLFIVGLLLAATASALLVNCVVQKDYSTDYVAAQKTTDHLWNEHYGEERTEEGLTKMLRTFLTVQAVLNGLFIIIFLILARTAFRCLKWDNQAMSHLVFLGNILLLGFGLTLVYLAQNAYGYGDYPQVRAHFPVWNIKALFFLGIFAAVTALIGFLVDHRSWRVGFFVLTFLLVTIIVLLGNFTGLAYRHTNNTYNYYKGTNDVATCLNRMPYVNLNELENVGCPAKYLEPINCAVDQRVTRWEPYPPATPAPQTVATPAATPAAATPALTFTFDELQYADSVMDETRMLELDDLQNAAAATTTTTGDATTGTYCLNQRCCGLQGQVYGHDLLRLANFGLFTILAGLLLTIACTYFWYVKWIDSARDKRRDFVWLTIMIFTIVGFVVLLLVRDVPTVSEQVTAGGKHV